MLTRSFSMRPAFSLSRMRRGFIATICLLVIVAAVVFVQSAPAPAPAGDPCVAPGVSIVTDASGDTGTGSLGTAPGSPAQDITEVLISEPAQADGVARLAITIRVADLTTLPASGIWRVFFTNGATTYFAGAFNDPTAGMQYNYGTAGTGRHDRTDMNTEDDTRRRGDPGPRP